MVRVGRVAAARWTDTAVPLSHRPSQRMCDVQGDGEGTDGSGGVDAEQSHRAKKQESDGMCGESKRWLNINNVGMQVAKCIMQIRGVGMTRGAGCFVHMSMRRHRVGISHLIGRGLNPIFNSAFPGKVFLPCTFLPCKKMFLLGLFCGGEIVQDSDLLGCYPSCPSFRPRAYLLSPSRWLAGSPRSSLNPGRSLAHSIPFKSVNGAQPESLAHFQTL